MTFDPNIIYTATGLSPETTYSFRYRARDSAEPANYTNWTAAKSATTDKTTTPPILRLDFNTSEDNNTIRLQPGFTPFVIANSGNAVSGVTIDIENANQKRVDDPCGQWSGTAPNQEYYSRAGEAIYQDMIFGIVPNGIKMTLYGLGMNRDCNITLFAYDNKSISEGNRAAHWYSNGTYIFDTNFVGGISTDWPRYDAQYPNDMYKWAVSKRVMTDTYGRIILTSTQAGTASPFSFMNALIVEPNGTYVASTYATRPNPIDGEEDVNVVRLLKWRNGDGVDKHDLYLDPNELTVTNADRTSPSLIGKDLAPDANAGYDPCRGGTYNEFLALDTSYYWRVDENDIDTATIYEGEVWSFSTLPYYCIDDFNSYASSAAMSQVWKDYQYQSGGYSPVTRSDVLVATDPNLGGPPYQSMQYKFNNAGSPYYAEANATVGTGTNELHIDPNWDGMNAKSLSIFFYGQATGNDANKPMYMKLADDTNTAKQVNYSGDMNDIRDPNWHEWNLPLANFTGINLKKIKYIVIGFGNKTVSTNGVVYFENLVLWASRCALLERDAAFAELDYSPAGINPGDCVIDYQEIATMADTWLSRDAFVKTKDPNLTGGLVVYYPFNENDGNRAFSHPVSLDVCDTKWTATFWNSGSNPPGVLGTTWVSTSGISGIGGASHVYMSGVQGSRILGGGTVDGNRLGIGPGAPYTYADDTNAITLSIWVKWLGNRTWDPTGYLQTKCQGLLGKRGGWDDASVIWMLELDTNGTNRSIGLRHYAAGGQINNTLPDAFADNGAMNPYLGRWVHVAASFPHTVAGDANAHARLYINGGLAPGGDDPWRFSAGIDNDIGLSIGETQDQNAWINCPESYWGYLDEVRIYKRALEANEIAYLADVTPEDGNLWIPVPSSAEVYEGEPEGSRAVNFRDLAKVGDANNWLKEEMYPR
jgi:hypothetical protein